MFFTISNLETDTRLTVRPLPTQDDIFLLTILFKFLGNDIQSWADVAGFCSLTSESDHDEVVSLSDIAKRGGMKNMKKYENPHDFWGIFHSTGRDAFLPQLLGVDW